MLSDEEKKAIQMIKNQKEEVDEALIAMEIPENYIGEDVEQEYLEWQKNADIILNLIEKQQKEIEELKEDNKHQWEERCKLTFELENSTSNDKIKAKIEPKLKELDEQINEEWKKYGNSKELQDMEDMYNFLQSLLEKE